MCHFDNFDIDQIASKLAQRWNFVHSFYCKKISVLDSFDNAKNAKRHLFFGHPIYRPYVKKKGGTNFGDCANWVCEGVALNGCGSVISEWYRYWAFQDFSLQSLEEQ